MEMLREVEKFLHQSEMPATKFGRLVAHDPRLVLDMRMGREVRRAMQQKIRHFIDNHPLKKAA